MFARLRDLEISAMLKHAGIWAESDPERIAELREKQRSEDQELKELQIQVNDQRPPQGLFNVNTASQKELQSIKGIGPVLAARIAAGRPYETVDDLISVRGISHRVLEDIRPYFNAGKEYTRIP